MTKVIFKHVRVRSHKELREQKIDELSVSRLDSIASTYDSLFHGKMVVFAHEHIGVRINQYGYYDKDALDLLFLFLNPVLAEFKTGYALDIGANIGNHALFFSRYFSKVVAFEPHPRIFELLALNSRLADNIDVYNFGISDQDGVVQLKENRLNMGASSMSSTNITSLEIDVQVKRLESVDVAGSVEFVKIDVEGFEANVIKGGLSLIEKHRPIIVFEQHKIDFVGNSTETIDYLHELGYQICWKEKNVFSKKSVVRRFQKLMGVLNNRKTEYRIVTGDIIPVDNYGMLIAIPKRHYDKFGF